MNSSLLLAFLFLTPVLVVTLRPSSQCATCGWPAVDLESHRELLLNLAKRSILDKLHLSQRPTLSRPVSRAALRTALQHLRGPPQGDLLEDNRRQEYEIISFAETGGFLVCSSASKPALLTKGSFLTNLIPDFLPQLSNFSLPCPAVPGFHLPGSPLLAHPDQWIVQNW